jgi:4-hydroxybenzoate polyprenyltransferase
LTTSAVAISRWQLDLRRYLQRAGHYARLMRLHRPIGIWLLLWPVLWALWIAGDGHPTPRVLVVFVLGVLVMRAAGCIVNDLADRDFDPHVKRTRDRPLAARCVSPFEALIMFLLLIGVALFLVLQLDRGTLMLAVVGAGLTVTYPFFKRFFPLPQLYLGVAFAWGVPMVFMAELGAIPRVAWTLLLAGVLWAAVYDTQYAMVDRDDDLKIGVKSSAIMFGDMDRVIIGVLQAMMLFALHLAGNSMQFGIWYSLGLVGAGVFFVYQQWLIRNRDPAGCFRAFTNNQFVGMSVFVGVLLHYTFRGG